MESGVNSEFCDRTLIRNNLFVVYDYRNTGFLFEFYLTVYGFPVTTFILTKIPCFKYDLFGNLKRAVDSRLPIA